MANLYYIALIKDNVINIIEYNYNNIINKNRPSKDLINRRRKLFFES